MNLSLFQHSLAVLIRYRKIHYLPLRMVPQFSSHLSKMGVLNENRSQRMGLPPTGAFGTRRHYYLCFEFYFGLAHRYAQNLF